MLSRKLGPYLGDPAVFCCAYPTASCEVLTGKRSNDTAAVPTLAGPVSLSNGFNTPLKLDECFPVMFGIHLIMKSNKLMQIQSLDLLSYDQSASASIGSSID